MSSYDNYNDAYMIYGLIICWFSVIFLAFLLYTPNWTLKSLIKSPFVSFLLIHSLSFASTSMIEEEHQTWYFLWSSLTTVLFWRCIKRNILHKNAIISLIFALILHRALRGWNRTGDKWRHLEDFGDWLGKYTVVSSLYQR